MGAQYNVCQHESAEAFWVMGMKLRAEGQTANEVDEARIEAMRQGSLEIPQTGTARYWWQTGESIASDGDFTSQCDNCINRASNRAGFINQFSRQYRLRSGVGLHALVGQRNDAGREMIHPNPSTKSYRGGETLQYTPGINR